MFFLIEKKQIRTYIYSFVKILANITFENSNVEVQTETFQ